MWFICPKSGVIVPVLGCNCHTAYWDNSLSPSVWQAVYTSSLFCISAFRLSSEPSFHNLIKKKKKKRLPHVWGEVHACPRKQWQPFCPATRGRDRNNFEGFFLFPVRLRGCLWRGSKKNPLMWCGWGLSTHCESCILVQIWLRKLLGLCCAAEKEECPEFLLNVDWKSQMATW